jgi:hypothetical protein
MLVSSRIIILLLHFVMQRLYVSIVADFLSIELMYILLSLHAAAFLLDPFFGSFHIVIRVLPSKC